MSAAPDNRPGRTPTGAAASRVALLLAVVAFLSVLGLGYGLYRLHRTELATLSQEVNALRTDAASKEELESQAKDARQALKTQSDRLDTFAAALADMRRQSEEGRDAWIKAEAASLLVAANEEVEIRADPALAIKALQEADGRLRLVSDPRLIPVRQEIAREISALQSVPQPDIEGMALSLMALADGIDRLPLKRSVPEHYVPGGATPPENTAPTQLTLWQKLKAATAGLMSQMFTVRHHNAPLEPLLAPREEFFLRRNLELRLQSARAALLDREDAAFHDSVHGARVWIADYFDAGDGGVKAALQQLADMEKQSIAPKLPDISASLTALRALTPPRATAP